LLFDFETNVPTTDPGSIVMFPDYDARDALQSSNTYNTQKATAHYGSEETNIFQSASCVFRDVGLDPKYVQLSGSNGIVSDATITTAGTFNVVALTSFTCPASGLGTIKIHYSISYYVNELQITGADSVSTSPWLWNSYTAVSSGTNLMGDGTATQYASRTYLSGNLNEYTTNMPTWSQDGSADFIGSETSGGVSGATLRLPYDATGVVYTNNYFVALQVVNGGNASTNAISFTAVDGSSAVAHAYIGNGNSTSTSWQGAIIVSGTTPAAGYSFAEVQFTSNVNLGGTTELRLFIMMLPNASFPTIKFDEMSEIREFMKCLGFKSSKDKEKDKLTNFEDIKCSFDPLINKVSDAKSRVSWLEKKLEMESYSDSESDSDEDHLNKLKQKLERRKLELKTTRSNLESALHKFVPEKERELEH